MEQQEEMLKLNTILVYKKVVQGLLYAPADCHKFLTLDADPQDFERLLLEEPMFTVGELGLGSDEASSNDPLRSYAFNLPQGIIQRVARSFDELALRAGAPSFASLDKAEKWVEDELLTHVHALAQRWLVDKACKMVYNRALLHDALTAHSTMEGRIGPSQLLRWSRRTFVPKGQRILVEGQPDDGLYLLYRGLVDVCKSFLDPFGNDNTQVEIQVPVLVKDANAASTRFLDAAALTPPIE